MFRLCAKIEIKGDRAWSFNFVNAVEITRDTEKLTTEAKITMPKKVKWDKADKIPVKRGDSVKISLGYDDNLQTAFVGYVRDVGFKTPIVITCEDEMFKLKQMPTKKKAYRSVSLETLLKDQGISYRLNIMGEQALGAYRVTADTVAALLGKLSEQGIRSFFRYENGAPVLYCGVLFERDTRPAQVFKTGLNIISDQSLQQQKAENMRLRVKAVSLMPDNKKIKVEVGDADGEHRTLHTYNKTESELKAWAEQEIKRLKRDGLTGSFTTFGHTLVDCLDAIGIVIDGVKSGVYQVKKNIVKYGDGGYRQEITLGLRVG
nr:MAG TPA_asm: tail protein [Caudoviricetes sp.]